MPHHINDHARDVVTLSADQFAKLVELLTPGYEMAKLWMTQDREAKERAEKQVSFDRQLSASPPSEPPPPNTEQQLASSPPAVEQNF